MHMRDNEFQRNILEFAILILVGPCKLQYVFSFRSHTQRHKNGYVHSLVSYVAYDSCQ